FPSYAVMLSCVPERAEFAKGGKGTRQTRSDGPFSLAGSPLVSIQTSREFPCFPRSAEFCRTGNALTPGRRGKVIPPLSRRHSSGNQSCDCLMTHDLTDVMLHEFDV